MILYIIEIAVFLVVAYLGIMVIINSFDGNKPEVTDFPCSSCGSCCKRAGVVAGLNINLDAENPLYFPYSCDETGRCEKLTDDNKCSVYDNRPLVCNVKELCLFLEQDPKEFYKFNASVCNTMMDEDNVPLEFRINVKQF